MNTIISSIILLLGLLHVCQGEDISVQVYDQLPAGGQNAYYLCNRPPLKSTPLVKLPLGSVHARGWLQTQLRLMANGFTGHLSELSDFCTFADNAWTRKDGGGEHGWEEVPYWLRGFYNLGVLLDDERIIQESDRWIQAVIHSQQQDGYFGSKINRKNKDLWPNMIMLFVLRSYYEASGDPTVIDFIKRYFKWQMSIPLEDFLHSSWQKWRGGDNLALVYWLYNHTREPWLLDLARITHERTADWTGSIPTWHGVNLCQGFREPAQYYQQAKDQRYLRAAVRNYNRFIELYGQVPGGMFGADENCRIGFYGPRQAAEACSMVEMMFSLEKMTLISGDPIWADRCEEVAFNTLPASMTPDLRGLHYLTAPNQIQLDRKNKAPLIQNHGDMFSYNPWRYRCCQHNVAFGWPYFTEHLWMATADNGLAAVMYAPSTVKAKVGNGKTIKIEQQTTYPFSDTIDLLFTARSSVRFPLVMRIPDWCKAAKLYINNVRQPIDVAAKGWLKIDRIWKDGDRLRWTLPSEFNVKRWKKNKNGISVHKGPLLFSLKIEEEWQAFGDSDAWPGYEVFPSSNWNYGLMLNPQVPQSAFEIVHRDTVLNGQPFSLQNAPLLVSAAAKRIPQWKQEDNGMIGALQKGPVLSDQAMETVYLVPAGCARLRLTMFPEIGKEPNATAWNELVMPKATASHCYKEDTITALYDAIVPARSNNSMVPRLTFWDHRGSREWVRYSFRKMQTLQSCKVFWYDDTGKGSTRVPKSWRVEYKRGDEWQKVEPLGDYTVHKDRFNAIHFKPVTTTAVRLVIDLQSSYTVGILEWQIDRI